MCGELLIFLESAIRHTHAKAIHYPQDNSGDENWHIFAIDLDNGNVPDLTPDRRHE